MTFKVYDYNSYLGLGINGPWTPPFALENRGPRDEGGFGNYYANRGEFADNILGIVLHITAGVTDTVAPDYSAESTNSYGRTTNVAASWTGLVDSDSIINSLHPKRVAWVHGVQGYNFNRPLMGLEIGKRTSDWRNHPQQWVDNTLKNAAAYCAPYVIRYNIPLRLIQNRDEVQRLINNRQPVGFTEHYILTGTSNRNDAGYVQGIGTTFPWERFFYFLRQVIDHHKGKPTPDPTPAPHTVVKGTVLESTTGLNTRSGPGTQFPVLFSVPKGSKIVATGNVKGNWAEAQTVAQEKSGEKSWWNLGYLQVTWKPKPVPPSYPTLKVGSSGSAVRLLQSEALRVFPSYAGSTIGSSGGADGKFGQGTERFVKEFQKRAKADGKYDGDVTGVVNTATWHALFRYGFKKP